MDTRRRQSPLSAIALGALVWLGCEGESPHRGAPSELPSGAHVEQLDPDAFAAEPAPPAVADAPPGLELIDDPAPAPPQPIERAPATDTISATDEPVRARRYVYRVQLYVPEALGVDRSDIALPAGELFIDVSADRLRARFVGPGWPVAAGSEVRVRGDSPGVYVFDRDGGRSLAPGAMAEWFEGGPLNRAGPPLSVRRDPQRIRDHQRAAEIPGALICALLAEWGGEPRESVIRRCDGSAPLGFRVGLWRAERTADVPVEVPRRALRADEIDPPTPVERSTSRAFLEPTAMGRLPRMEHAPHDLPIPDSGPPEGLEFVNQSEARVVVTVEGVPIGWVDSGARALFVGLGAGPYRVAALRPLGAVVIRPRIVVIPGTTLLRMLPRSTD